MFVAIEIQLFKNGYKLLIATCLMAIETGTDKMQLAELNMTGQVLPEQIMAQLSIKR